MKILITGGCGFIGSHVAERFYMEGHDVFIIDNLSRGKRDNVNCRHKFYRFGVEDTECEKIFKNNRFDIVVHLAAQIDVETSVDNPYIDSKTNLLGLTNMLDLSRKYAVKKFIFVSSAAVYGTNGNIPLKEDYEASPMSPYGMSKYTGEYYCKKWKELFDLDTVSLRFSNVYGPRQRAKGEGGVVSVFIEKVCNEKKIIVYGDGEQTRDFIYVSDVADAIYRSIYSTSSDVMNISTGEANSINHLIDIIGSIEEYKDMKNEVEYKKERKNDIKHSLLDNTRAKRELDWTPMVSLKEGIEKTYRWWKKNQSKFSQIRPEAEDKPEKKRNMFLKALPYIENIILFFVFMKLSELTGSFSGGTINFIFIIYIILMGIIHGLRQSSIAFILSSALYVVNSLNAGRDLAFLMYDINGLIHIASYFIIGISVGYVIDKKDHNIKLNKDELARVEKRLNLLNGMCEENIRIKDLLQEQIINSEDSFGKIFNIVSQLDSTEKENIFSSAVNVVSEVMRSEDVLIYIVGSNANFLRLMAKSKTNAAYPKSIRLEDIPEFKNILDGKEVFTNKELNNELPMMAAPIVDNGKTVALIMINDTKFENPTLYYINLFEMVVRLITSSLSRAYIYEKALKDRNYIAGTAILKPDAYKRILQYKEDAKEKGRSEFTQLRVENKYRDVREISRRISVLIRDVDYLGMGEEGNIYIILSNTNSSEAMNVKIRMACEGIPVAILD